MAQFNKKEKLIFWNALSMGIIGGVIGNFFVGSYFDYINNTNSLTKGVAFFIWSIFFLGLIWFIGKQLKKNL